MPALVAGIQARTLRKRKNERGFGPQLSLALLVDGRDKPGHDGG